MAALYNASRKKASESTYDEGDAETLRSYTRAFAELVSFVEETLVESHNENTSPVLKLTDLIKLYSDRLSQLGLADSYVLSTRFKGRILAIFPELQVFKEGRDILLIANEDMGISLWKAYENDADDSVLTLARAANIVREEVMNVKTQFSGPFARNYQAEAIPGSLATLVAMLLYGANNTEQTLVAQTQF